MITKILFRFKTFVFFSILIANYVSQSESQNLIKILESKYNTFYKGFLRLQTLPFEDCGSHYDVLYLSISSCDKIPCLMKRDTNVLVNIIFDDNGSSPSFLKHEAEWIFNTIRTNATVTPDLCDGNKECIVNVSDGKSLSAHLAVNDSLPCLIGTMVWKGVTFMNGRETAVICLRIPVLIKE